MARKLLLIPDNPEGTNLGAVMKALVPFDNIWNKVFMNRTDASVVVSAQNPAGQVVPPRFIHFTFLLNGGMFHDRFSKSVL